MDKMCYVVGMTDYQIQAYYPASKAWDNWVPAYWKNWRKRLAECRKECPSHKFRAIKVTTSIRIINTRRKRNIRSIYSR